MTLDEKNKAATRAYLHTIVNTWTKDTYCTTFLAVDAHGNSVKPRSTKACKWCALGIIHHTTLSVQRRTWLYAIVDEALHVQRLDYILLTEINDEQGYKATHALFVYALRHFDTLWNKGY